MLNDKFNLEVNTGSGGYGFIDDIEELCTDVENEYGLETSMEVKKWAINSKENEKLFYKNKMVITNLGPK